MDKRIKEIFLSIQMKHIRKSLHHLIMLERCIPKTRVVNTTYTVQNFTAGASPFETVWSYKKDPVELIPRLKHKLKIVHFDQPYHNLKQWNSVHLLSNEESDSISDHIPFSKYDIIDISETSNRTKIQYGLYPLSCVLEIINSNPEYKTPMSIVNYSVITIEEYKDHGYKGGMSAEKTWSVKDLKEIEFNSSTYRNTIFHLFPYVENIIKCRCDEELVDPSYREEFREFLELISK